MTIALMSRGYLCGALRFLPSPFPTPQVLGVVDDKPAVTGAALAATPVPSIKKAASERPSLRGATVAPTVAAPKPPAVTKAKTDAPTIRSAKKDWR